MSTPSDPGASARLTAALSHLAATIEARAAEGNTGRSWTAKLLAAGPEACSEKVTEEARELVHALLHESETRAASEAADLLYHVLVALKARGVSLDAVAEALEGRQGQSGLAEKAARVPDEAKPLFAYLDALGLAHKTHWHEALFTVDQSAALKAAMPGAHTKNLFLKDKDGALILIAAEAHADLKLNQLHKLIGCKRLSFGTPELMQSVLGVMPGSVTALALMNDSARRVRFLVDQTLAEAAIVNFHPLINTGTTALSQADFRRFVDATGHRFEIIDFTRLDALTQDSSGEPQ